MKLFILLDISGSMEGAKIGALNDSMSNIIMTLQESSVGEGSLELSILTIGKTAKWMYDRPKKIGDFAWIEQQANGMTPLGSACKELDVILNDCSSSNEKVTIILLSDGCPTDDYENGIEVLNNNIVFVNSHRYVIALGEDADLKSLRQFANDDAHLFTINTMNQFFDTFMQVTADSKEHVSHTVTVQTEDDDDEWS